MPDLLINVIHGVGIMLTIIGCYLWAMKRNPLMCHLLIILSLILFATTTLVDPGISNWMLLVWGALIAGNLAVMAGWKIYAFSQPPAGKRRVTRER